MDTKRLENDEHIKKRNVKHGVSFWDFMRICSGNQTRFFTKANFTCNMRFGKPHGFFSEQIGKWDLWMVVFVHIWWSGYRRIRSPGGFLGHRRIIRRFPFHWGYPIGYHPGDIFGLSNSNNHTAIGGIPNSYPRVNVYSLRTWKWPSRSSWFSH